MAFVTPAQYSLNGGELSPHLLARRDQNITSIGVKRMDGWLPLLSGPAEACPGTIFVTKAKLREARLMRYQFNRTQGYQIELGANYARFYTNDAQIMDGDEPYEIATPWNAAQVAELYTYQSLDVLYCAHPRVPLHRIYRTSADTFACEPYVLLNGPLEARNADKTLTVSASATSGTDIDIVATADLFAAGDVGGLLEIESPAFGTTPAWEAGMTTAPGAYCQSNGNVYVNAGGARTGTVAPIHIEGTESDGMGGTDINGKGPYGVQWTFVHGMFGLVRLTEYVSPTAMKADVLRTLPTTNACWRFSFGAFSTRRGHPGTVGVWQERLVLGKDATLYGSVAGALDDMATRNELGDISRDQAFRYPLPSADAILWLVDDQQLIVGTGEQEHVVMAAGAAAGAGPGNLDRGVPADNGSIPHKPVKVDGRVVHIQAASTKAMQLAYDTNRLLRAESPNLSRFADHIGEDDSGLCEIAWLKEPRRHMWFRRTDGTLAVMGYDPAEEYVAWATRTLGGGLKVRSISENTDPAGRYQQLWIMAEAGGESWVLRMAPLRSSKNRDEQVMTDAAVRLTGPLTSIEAPHLAGRRVDICADGRPIMDVQLDGNGRFALPFEARDVIVGLRFDAEIDILPPAGGSENGTSLGKVKRCHRIDLYVVCSDELEVACQGASELTNLLRPQVALDTALPLANGQHLIELGSDHDREMAITVRRIYPRPSTLAAIVPHFEAGQA
jgi:hypothetical protein